MDDSAITGSRHRVDWHDVTPPATATYQKIRHPRRSHLTLTAALLAWRQSRSNNPNDYFAEMRAGRHVPIGGLRVGKTKHLVDHRLDRVRRDGAVHCFEHLR
jgi:hypothetical protein